MNSFLYLEIFIFRDETDNGKEKQKIKRANFIFLFLFFINCAFVLIKIKNVLICSINYLKLIIITIEFLIIEYTILTYVK